MGIFDKFRRKTSVQRTIPYLKWYDLASRRPGLDVITRFEHPERGLLATGRAINGRISVGDELSASDGAAYLIREIERLRYDVPESCRAVSSVDPGEDIALVLTGGGLDSLEKTRELLRLEPGDI